MRWECILVLCKGPKVQVCDVIKLIEVWVSLAISGNKTAKLNQIFYFRRFSQNFWHENTLFIMLLKDFSEYVIKRYDTQTSAYQCSSKSSIEPDSIICPVTAKWVGRCQKNFSRIFFMIKWKAAKILTLLNFFPCKKRTMRLLETL